MKKNVTLCRACDMEILWQKAMHPWFVKHAIDINALLPSPPRPPERIAVLTPSMTFAAFIRAQLASSTGFIGIDFLAPGQCWEALHSHLTMEAIAAPRETLHLLLSSAAAQHAEEPSARSVAVDPSGLMRALDQLAAAGYSHEELGIDSMKPVVRTFHRFLNDAGFTVTQEIDRAMAHAAAKAPPLFTRLLVAGFDSRHWPALSLLRAAVMSSSSALVCLTEPRLAAEKSDQVWIDTWEHEFGEAEMLAGTVPRPMAPLTAAIETGSRHEGADVRFLVGNTIQDEALAIAAQAVAYLSNTQCSRLGIVLPGPGPLARHVTRLLEQYGIEHHDTVGYPEPVDDAEAAWQAWLDFQSEPCTATLVALMRFARELLPQKDVTLDETIDGLVRAQDEMLVDNPLVLAARLQWNELTTRLPVLPQSAGFAAFVGTTTTAIASLPSLKPDERIAAIVDKARGVSADLRTPVPRTVFLDWLGAVCGRRTKKHSISGSHRFARVQVVTYDSAEWQMWTHLIMAGLNRDSWPPEYRDQQYLDQTRIDSFNRSALRTGADGSGQKTVKQGRGLIIGPAERSAHLHRQFYNILEAASHSVCMTAARTDPDDATRRWNPSELLVRVHASAVGGGLSDDTIDRLQTATHAWIAKCDLPRPSEKNAEPDSSLNSTVTAYRTRRDPSRPFGEYDCSTGGSLTADTRLPCTAWEAAISSPELVFLNRFLGVEDTSLSRSEIAWQKTLGIRVHRWLSEAMCRNKRTWSPLPTSADFRKNLERLRVNTRKALEAAFIAAGTPVPEWWHLVFDQAVSVSDRFASELEKILDSGQWEEVATEYRLEKNAVATLPDGTRLPLSGMIDIAFRRHDRHEVWVIDYKTGARIDFTPSNVAGGEGMQILLYGMALQNAGAATCHLTRANPDQPVEPQQEVNELAGEERVSSALLLLSGMNKSGVFGTLGNPRGEFGVAPVYPLATLPVNPDILEAKQRLTVDKVYARQKP